tara:strand:- start:666 stop:1739 length:1074 start_codon:yes stop_codon:yes gene_type:complete
MGGFDTSSINDESLKTLYNYLLERTHNIINVFKNVYSLEDKSVDVSFIVSNRFQAEATCFSNKGYSIKIHSPTIFLMRLYFDAVLSLDPVANLVTPLQRELKPVDINFIPDVTNPLNQIKHQVYENQDRLFVSSTMTDLCSTFIALHEVGHIVCGHAETAKLYFGEDQILEVLDYDYFFKRGIILKQSMERDADVLSARLIPQYIEQLFEKINIDSRHSKAFQTLMKDSYPFENLIALCVSSLYSLFVYITPKRPVNFRKLAHPHPILRALYIKDAIINTLEERWPLRKDVVSRYCVKYFDQFDRAFGLLDMNIAHLYAGEFLTIDHDEEISLIHQRASKMRKFSAKSSWFPIEEWQ